MGPASNDRRPGRAGESREGFSGARAGLALAAAALLTACATTKPAAKRPEPTKAPAAASAAPAPAATEASLEVGGDFAARADLKNAPFDYDSAELSGGALAILKANAAVVKANAGIEVLVAGNCDERGTTAYNLALGQRRAKAVRDYYIRLGVDGARVATISYGKERPLCSESTAACWSRNRRGETLARARAPSSASAR